MDRIKEEKLRQEFEDKPKGVCKCGHTGDGKNSQHYDGFQAGHGACKVKGCNCGRFTWVKWTPEFGKALEEAMKAEPAQQAGVR